MNEAPVITPLSDYECFIHVHNKTDVDFGLYESKPIEGRWEKGSPPNTIEGGKQGTIRLNDEAGPGNGTEGYAIYEMVHPTNPTSSVQVKIEFRDPYWPGQKNFLGARSSNPTLFSCNVLDYQRTGHPFTGHVEIYMATKAAIEEAKADREVPRNANGSVRAEFDIGFDAGLLLHKQSIHEDIAIAAFIKAELMTIRFPRGTTYNNLTAHQWEYIRGLLWPDDPSCWLFEDLTYTNSKQSTGAKWASEFFGIPFKDDNCLTQRSHFGNLQFLHAMAVEFNEDASKTKKNLLDWLEVMYKLAIGTQVSQTDKLDKVLPNHFSPGDKTLRDLLLGNTTQYMRYSIPKRALGVCLHIVQDSYSVGHTLRRLRNPDDLAGVDSEGFPVFKDGRYAQLGPIITFHTYKGQNNRHTHYDTSPQNRTPYDLESFNDLIGARDAIDKSQQLINYFAKATKWEDGVSEFLSNDIFGLDPKHTKSNHDVDERFGIPDTSSTSTGTSSDTTEDYHEGLERKLSSLESGLASSAHASAPGRMERMLSVMNRPSSFGLTALRCIIIFFALALTVTFGEFAVKPW